MVSLISLTAMTKRRRYAGLKLTCFLFFLISGYWFVREVPDMQPGTDLIPEAVTSLPANQDSCLQLLRSGDIVLRTGNDELSNVFRHLNTRNQTYSHAGLVFIEKGRAVVYHSIGGADNPDGQLRRDPVAHFVRSRQNLGWAIVRPGLDSSALQMLKLIVDSLYRSRVRFDSDFNMDSDDRLYCTEFVYKSILRASGDPSFLSLTVADGRTYVAVDDLFNNKHSQTICELHYK